MHSHKSWVLTKKQTISRASGRNETFFKFEGVCQIVKIQSTKVQKFLNMEEALLLVLRDLTNDGLTTESRKYQERFFSSHQLAKTALSLKNKIVELNRHFDLVNSR